MTSLLPDALPARRAGPRRAGRAASSGRRRAASGGSDADAACLDPRPKYVVGPQDVLTLTVFNDDTLSRPALTVDSEGTIDVPYINRVKVAGLTTRQIEEELRRQLGVRTDEQGRLRGFLKNPNISVTVKEFRSQRVYVTGAVRIPRLRRAAGGPDADARVVGGGIPDASSPAPTSSSRIRRTASRRRPRAPGQTSVPRIRSACRGKTSTPGARAGSASAPATSSSSRRPTSSSSPARSSPRVSTC